jgi:hypothetical protein
MNFPLTINALEFGKSFFTFGGRPISRAFSKSFAAGDFFSGMAQSPLKFMH